MKKLNKLICKLFGCKMYEEVWAHKNVRLRDMKGRTRTTYDVRKRCTCARCGKVENYTVIHGLSKERLLMEGWFIER